MSFSRSRTSLDFCQPSHRVLVSTPLRHRDILISHLCSLFQKGSGMGRPAQLTSPGVTIGELTYPGMPRFEPLLTKRRTEIKYFSITMSRNLSPEPNINTNSHETSEGPQPNYVILSRLELRIDGWGMALI